jgi:hypothetical protein
MYMQWFIQHIKNNICFGPKKLSTIDTNDFCEKNAPKYKMILRFIFFLGHVMTFGEFFL